VELWLENDVRVKLDEAFSGAKKIQGENARRAWCDEVGLWRPPKMAEYAWDESLLPAVRVGESPQVVCTFTPKRTPLARRLLKDSDAVVRRLRMWDNAANLSSAFLRQMEKRYKGTRLGQQELEGILLEDVEGALWRFEWIESGRRDGTLPKGAEGGPPVFWQSRRVALDPADGLEDGDEQGVAVVGIGSDWDMYVIASEGLRTNPYGMCKHGIKLALEHEGASIIVEKNHGGEALTDLLELAMQEMGVRVPYRMISASRNKIERAEPVAALYEQEHGGKRKVHHLDVFPELEEEMTSFTGQPGEPSPDRLDALVHGLTELMGHNWHGPGDPDVQGDAVVPYNAPRGAESAVVTW
jgi:phage terminase large subunit-like protein